MNMSDKALSKITAVVIGELPELPSWRLTAQQLTAADALAADQDLLNEISAEQSIPLQIEHNKATLFEPFSAERQELRNKVWDLVNEIASEQMPEDSENYEDHELQTAAERITYRVFNALTHLGII